MQRRQLLQAAVAGAFVTTGLAACSSNSQNAKTAKSGKSGRDYITIGMPNGTQTENHNPLAPTSSAGSLGYKWMLYEPLLMWNPVQPAEKAAPWLAESATWAADYKSVDIVVRDNAKWSDGQPVTADDVAYTFTVVNTVAGLNQYAIPFDQITSSGNTCHITFKSSQYVNQNKLLAQSPIIPKHIWTSISNPATDINKKPVGSGPYTLTSFSQAGVVLDQRTDGGYWQAMPEIKQLRYTSYSTNDTQTTALTTGECEWSFVFIPNYKTVFIDKDSAHYKVWAPGVLGIHGLYLNVTKAPFNDVKLRQAMNMVVNRDDIFNQAEAGYFHPEISSVTGLPNGAGDAFIAPAYQNKKLTPDVAGAKALLASAGYKLTGGKLIAPSGKPVTITLTDPAPWSDYQTTLSILQSNFQQLGIQTSIDKADQNAWDQNVQKGDFEGAMRWTNGGATPYDLYETVMDGALLKPIGTASQQGNFGRFNNPQATAALAAFANATDDAARTAAMATIEQIFVEQVPMLPVGSDNVGAAYSTKNWVGWPDDTNKYAGAQPTQPYALEVVLKLKAATS